MDKQKILADQAETAGLKVYARRLPSNDGYHLFPAKSLQDARRKRARQFGVSGLADVRAATPAEVNQLAVRALQSEGA